MRASLSSIIKDMFGIGKLLPRIVSTEWDARPVKGVVLVDAPSSDVLDRFIEDVQREFHFVVTEPFQKVCNAKLTYEVIHRTETSASLITFDGYTDQVKMIGLKAAAKKHGVQFVLLVLPDAFHGPDPTLG